MLIRARMLLAVGTVLALAACSDPAPPPQPERVPATTWAASVCTTLAPWRASIGTSTTEAQQAIGPDSTPETVHTVLKRTFDGAASASDTAQAALAAQPAPDVGGGEDIRRTVIAYLTGARDAYAAASASLTGLDPAAKDFYDQVAATVTRLNTAYAAGPDLTAFDSPDLKTAFDTAPECR